MVRDAVRFLFQHRLGQAAVGDDGQGRSSCGPRPIKSHFESTTNPEPAYLCNGAKVCLQAKNFIPLWGLHNGACGTIDEYVFLPQQDPNNGGLPLYVVVDFPLYRGPAWDTEHPTHVPIPIVETMCDKSCCFRTYCPLQLCYARTIHKFQGLGAGPDEPGKPKHLFKSVVVDPDCQSCEATMTGLLYTAVSRGTTLGNDEGLGSAVYFIGPHLTKQRVMSVTKPLKGDTDLLRVQKRTNFVKHLQSNYVDLSGITTTQKKNLFQWFATNTRAEQEAYSYFYSVAEKYTSALASDDPNESQLADP